MNTLNSCASIAPIPCVTDNNKAADMEYVEAEYCATVVLRLVLERRCMVRDETENARKPKQELKRGNCLYVD